MVAWRKEPFYGERDRELINTFKSIKAKPRDQHIKVTETKYSSPLSFLTH